MLMDTVDMFNAERWLEIAEVMSYEVHTVEVQLPPASDVAAEAPAALIDAEPASMTSIPALAIGESAIAEAPAELEYDQLEAPQPRTARVLSIVELRQKLGIERCEPAAQPVTPADTRPRIIRRREPEYAVG